MRRGDTSLVRRMALRAAGFSQSVATRREEGAPAAVGAHSGPAPDRAAVGERMRRRGGARSILMGAWIGCPSSDSAPPGGAGSDIKISVRAEMKLLRWTRWLCEDTR